MKTLRVMRAACCVVLASILAGCATTHQTRSVEFSGFLNDYSMLREGQGDEALMVYINPETDFSAYDGVIIDSVTIWTDTDSAAAQAPPEEMKQLADHLYLALYNELKKDYQIVDRPGSGVLRIRAAITEARKSRILLDTLTNVLPPMIVMSTAKRLATGTHAFVGRAGLEAEILDSMTNKRVAAAVDERAGEKALRGKLGSWNDVKESHDFWAERLRIRLTELRGR